MATKRIKRPSEADEEAKALELANRGKRQGGATKPSSKDVVGEGTCEVVGKASKRRKNGASGKGGEDEVIVVGTSADGIEVVSAADREALRLALHECDSMGVHNAGLDEAKKALQEEDVKAEVAEAARMADINALRDVIREGEAAGLDATVLDSTRKILAKADEEAMQSLAARADMADDYKQMTAAQMQRAEKAERERDELRSAAEVVEDKATMDAELRQLRTDLAKAEAARDKLAGTARELEARLKSLAAQPRDDADEDETFADVIANAEAEVEKVREEARIACGEAEAKLRKVEGDKANLELQLKQANEDAKTAKEEARKATEAKTLAVLEARSAKDDARRILEEKLTLEIQTKMQEQERIRLTESDTNRIADLFGEMTQLKEEARKCSAAKVEAEARANRATEDAKRYADDTITAKLDARQAIQEARKAVEDKLKIEVEAKVVAQERARVEEADANRTKALQQLAERAEKELDDYKQQLDTQRARLAQAEVERDELRLARQVADRELDELKRAAEKAEGARETLKKETDLIQKGDDEKRRTVEKPQKDCLPRADSELFLDCFRQVENRADCLPVFARSGA